MDSGSWIWDEYSNSSITQDNLCENVNERIYQKTY